MWSMGLTMKDLFVEDRPPAKTSGRASVVATYDYWDDAGKLLAQKLRYSDKHFSWRRPVADGKWEYNRKGVPHRLYIAGKLGGLVHICEGEKDADNFHGKIGGCAVSGADGAGPGKWRREYSEQLRDRSVVIFCDNDDVGRAYTQETAAALHGAAKSVRVLDLSKIWPEIPEHGDVSDLIEGKGPAEAARLLVELERTTPEWVPHAEEKQSTPPKEVKPLVMISAPDLQRAQLPPVKFLVEGILPAGTSLLSAASKIGKSWLELDMGISIASGARFLGHATDQCGVLYLALEDSYHRLQNRMNKVLGGKPAPAQFYFSTAAPKLDDGLLDTLDDHLKKYRNRKLIIIKRSEGRHSHERGHTPRTTGRWRPSKALWMRETYRLSLFTITEK